ncbi:N-acetylmuramoyl-L-alanine amidase [Maribacter algarum]|uniref:N-acetylmuramoyl-L-alanine amidase n=1 Tax=Maribacter algarum (ex Zhang et al. 2020) TaxID=2578118 RepID=A0A5S3Q9T7_9FLAO|nr:N-acetylmuramoyl-L-alanine amidase [Maribacter algarum]
MNTKRFFVIPFSLLVLLLTSFVKNDVEENIDDPFVVVLDAGHGGHDPGNLGNGYLEKNIALNIVLKVGQLLESDPNIKVIYTRKDDTFIDLFVRGEIANKANADLFVSVHCDSHSSDAYGAGTFVLGLHANKQNFEIAKKENSVIYLEDNYETRYADYDINSPESVIGLTIMQEEFLDQSISLAKTIQENFTGKLKRKDREVKQAGFIVLHQTFMPSVLVETGFLTNDKEGAYLNSKKGQSEMGTAIAEAILSYKGGVASSLAQAPKKVIMPVPDPEKEVVTNTPRVEKSTPKKEVSAAEEFAKDPGANPMQNQPAAKEVVKKTLEEKIAAKEKEAPDMIDVVKEEQKITEVAEVVTKDEVVVEEKPQVVETAEEIIEKPKPSVVEKREPVIVKKEVAKPVKSASSVEFRVQLMAGSKNLPLEPSRFNGLNKLSKEPYKNLYRYMYGKANSYRDAQLLKKTADSKGYPTSYIVAYKDGVRIPTPQAIKMVSE